MSREIRSDDEAPIRPPLAFRLGVTGARALDPGAVPAVRAAVAALLARVRQRCGSLAAEPWAPRVHAVGAGGTEMRLTLLSPLAEGGDRLAAEEALAQDYALSVVMPFGRSEYERDFGSDVDGFATLLDRAEGRVLALDGGRGDDEWRSYEAVGRLVVRNCDLLIAIWDDATPPRGRGGTRDTMLFALHAGVPVWWIDAAGRRPPALVESLAALRHPVPAEAAAGLDRLIAGRLRPPPVPLAKPHGILHGMIATGSRLRHFVGRTPPHHPDPLAAFLADREESRSALWRGHRTLIRGLTWGAAPHASPPEPVASYWGEAYRPPDSLSGAYGLRYRSTYVYVIALAGLALIAASLASVFDAWHLKAGVVAMALAEVGALAVLLAFIVGHHVGRWHERWIGYRLLAELCRKQGALALLGWSLPNLGGTGDATGAGWIDWYVGALARAAPLASGSLAGEDLRRTRDAVSATLLEGQIAYHRHRAAESALAARRLFAAGEGCFFATLVFVLGKLVAPLSTGLTRGAVLIGLAAAVLPSVSAALFAVRAYAELDVLADQSERMVEVLERLKARLDALDTAVPLASQELGRDLYHLTSAMLADVAGWAQLFRMKGVEAG